jgi:hypothetical protein
MRSRIPVQNADKQGCYTIFITRNDWCLASKKLAGSSCIASGPLSGRPVALSSGEALELPCVHVAHPFPAVLG